MKKRSLLSILTWPFFALLLITASLMRADLPSRNESPFDAVARAEIIQDVLKVLHENYVFPEIAEKMERSILEHAARKEYDTPVDAVEFAGKLTNHLQQISHDKHLGIMPGSGSSPAAVPCSSGPAGMAAARRNFGFNKIERLPGNIGYLDLRMFEIEQLEQAKETAAAAMNFLAHTDALIVDLRKNGGGSGEMVAFLSSYLFDKRTHLNDVYDRPSDSTTEFWTAADVPGRRYGNKPVFVLTSHFTFSAAEEFTYNLKSLKRATVIGEATQGGAHPVTFIPLRHGFLASVPSGRSINPITKTNWEGCGVAPDIATATDSALGIAHLAALKTVQPTITDPQVLAQLKNLIDEMQNNPHKP